MEVNSALLVVLRVVLGLMCGEEGTTACGPPRPVALHDPHAALHDPYVAIYDLWPPRPTCGPPRPVAFHDLWHSTTVV